MLTSYFGITFGITVIRIGWKLMKINDIEPRTLNKQTNKDGIVGRGVKVGDP